MLISDDDCLANLEYVRDDYLISFGHVRNYSGKYLLFFDYLADKLGTYQDRTTS